MLSLETIRRWSAQHSAAHTAPVTLTSCLSVRLTMTVYQMPVLWTRVRLGCFVESREAEYRVAGNVSFVPASSEAIIAARLWGFSVSPRSVGMLKFHAAMCRGIFFAFLFRPHWERFPIDCSKPVRVKQSRQYLRHLFYLVSMLRG